MNENIDLTKILENCPKGTKLYSLIFGEVEFERIDNGCETITYKTNSGRNFDVSYEGKFFTNYDGECTLFPSKDQRDWSKFKAPCYKDKFDPRTLQPFDKVLVSDSFCKWSISLFAYYNSDKRLSVCCNYNFWKFCIPYNDDTKYLVGTTEEAPEYYRYWEN